MVTSTVLQLGTKAQTIVLKLVAPNFPNIPVPFNTQSHPLPCCPTAQFTRVLFFLLVIHDVAEHHRSSPFGRSSDATTGSFANHMVLPLILSGTQQQRTSNHLTQPTIRFQAQIIGSIAASEEKLLP